MDIDERIEQLVASDERLQLAIERTDRNLDKLTAVVADISESARRLERAAGVLPINDEELDRRLAELEAKARRKPQ